MSNISTEELRSEINAILKTADLTVVSAKKVREQVEKKLKCSLLSRKKEFDQIVMDFINQQNENDDDDEDEDDNEKVSNGKNDSESEQEDEEDDPSSDEDTKKKAKKRPQPAARKGTPKQKKKRKSINASESGSDSDGSDSDFAVRKKVAAKKKSAAGRGGSAAGTGPRKTTGFTRAYTLSPELASLMGKDSLPRHEVVKKVWALIKERNLYDPKNKQFAICDDELMKVMKVKRFRTFGMLKHLKQHFID